MQVLRLVVISQDEMTTSHQDDNSEGTKWPAGRRRYLPSPRPRSTKFLHSFLLCLVGPKGHRRCLREVDREVRKKGFEHGSRQPPGRPCAVERCEAPGSRTDGCV